MLIYNNTNLDNTYYNRFLQGREFTVHESYRAEDSSIMYRFEAMQDGEAVISWPKPAKNKREYASYTIEMVLKNVKSKIWLVEPKSLQLRELRPGNKLMIPRTGFFRRVHSCDTSTGKLEVTYLNDAGSHSLTTLSPKDLAPIRLAHHIFINEGFKMVKDHMDNFVYLYEHNDVQLFWVHWVQDCNYGIVVANNRLITCSLEYMHQLQNLKQLYISGLRKGTYPTVHEGQTISVYDVNRSSAKDMMETSYKINLMFNSIHVLQKAIEYGFSISKWETQNAPNKVLIKKY